MNCITNDRSYLRNINNNHNDNKQTHLPLEKWAKSNMYIGFPKKIPPFLLYPIKSIMQLCYYANMLFNTTTVFYGNS